MPPREPYGFLDAALRYNRASEHLAEVDRLVEEFKATPKEIGVPALDPDSLEEPIHHRFEIRDVPIPREIAIRVGEGVYNLRCALDYLIFALAWHDSGREPRDRWARRLQFPIESDIDRFERRRSTVLEGISEEHVAMLREYQPAEGCVWTEMLAALSDTDKHRHLSILAGGIDVMAEPRTYDVTVPKAGAEPDDLGFYDGADVDVETYTPIDVVFPDGRLVSETLQELQSEVRAVLTRFGREFVLRPVE